MKILIMTSSLDIGGAETHVCTLARSLKRKGNEVSVASGGGELIEILQKSGINHHFLPNLSVKQGEKYHFCQLLHAKTEIDRCIRNQMPTLVHSHTRICTLLAEPICRKLKIPLISTAHAHFCMNFPKNVLSRWGDGMIAVSEDILWHVAGASLCPKLMRVIPNGIELRKIEEKSK